MVGLIVASIAAGFSEAIVLAAIANAAAAMVAGADALHIHAGPFELHVGVQTALGVALGVAMARVLLQIVIAWLPARVAADIQARLRRDLFEAYTEASWSVRSQDREGLLQELMTGQINQTVQIALQVLIAFSGSAMFVSLSVAALLLSPIAALAILAAAICLFFILRPLARSGRLAGRHLSSTNVAHASAVGEAVRLTEETQVFGTNGPTRDRIGVFISDTRDAFFRFQLLGMAMRSLYQGLVILLIVAGLFALQLTGTGGFASLGAVVLMLIRASTYAQQYQTGYQALHQLAPYLERIDSAIARYEGARPVDGARALKGIHRFEFDAVNFSYRPHTPVLREVSFAVESGESIGVVGPSGAGKSTLAQIILRLREPQNGRYLVDGLSASSYRLDEWHRRVAYIPQEPRVFRGSVRDNIRFFRAITDLEVEEAARLAHIHDSIVSLPQGYDTVIGQVADAVSGGQRQRICMARALAEQPALLVLDEPTSALDAASERAVQKSLSELHGQVTLFIIAHRLSTLTECDRLFEMHEGRLDVVSSLAGLPDPAVHAEGDPAALPGSSIRSIREP